MTPFKIPIKNSFVTILPKFPDDNSFVAKALIVTANVCIPAFPPIEATIGIKKARATISSIVQLWFKEINLSILISISMVLNMIVAGLFGILVPVSLKKFNIDPAIASSVFVTTITDVIGFLSFLGIGAYFFYG